MRPSFPGVYALAGIVLSLIGVTGIHYGAAFLFWPLAITCFSLIVYPTLFTWGLMTGAFLFAAHLYIGCTIFELAANGTASIIFSDTMLVYLLYLAIIFIIASAFILAKPLPINEKAIH